MSNQVILLVEDNRDDADLTIRAFSKGNIKNEVVVAPDGVAALDYLFGTGPYKGRDTNIQPAVVLLDLKLPKLDGLEVLRQVRADAKTKCLPVVVLTSSREEEDIVRSYELGANSYVQKPVDFDHFLDAAHQLGLYWLLVNQPPPTGRGTV